MQSGAGEGSDADIWGPSAPPLSGIVVEQPYESGVGSNAGAAAGVGVRSNSALDLLRDRALSRQRRALSSNSGMEHLLAPELGNNASGGGSSQRDAVPGAYGGGQAASTWMPETRAPSDDFASIPAVGSIRSNVPTVGWAASWVPLDGGSKRRIGSTAGGSGAGRSPLELRERDPDAAAAEAGAPRHFFCPISCLIMRDPVMLPTGHTYDRAHIERWLQQGNSTCPLTGQKLTPPVTLTPNVALRNSIEEWCEKHAPYMLNAQRHVRPADGPSGAAKQPPRVPDPDLALAIQLQQDELAQLAQQRTAAATAAGAANASRPAVQRSGSAAVPPSSGPSRRSSIGATPDLAQRGWKTVTTALLLLLSIAYVTLFVLALWQGGWKFASMSLNPFVGPSSDALMAMGALTAQAVGSRGQWWRLFTSPFLNAGVIQLVGSLGTLWAFGRYMDCVLPAPSLSVPAVYLASAFIGALTSANLNANYVACGGSAGICALLGGVWADQLVKFQRYQHRLVTLVALALITVLFGAISLLPMLNIWYNAGAFVAGLLVAAMLLLLPRASGAPRSQRGRRWGTAVQAMCIVLLAAWVGLGVAGLVKHVDVDATSDFFSATSCLKLRWWQCVESDMTPNGCHYDLYRNGTTGFKCPSGAVVLLPANGAASSTDIDTLSGLCTQYCPTGSAAAQPPPAKDNWGNTTASPSPSASRLQGPLQNSTIPGQQLYSTESAWGESVP